MKKLTSLTLLLLTFIFFVIPQQEIFAADGKKIEFYFELEGTTDITRSMLDANEESDHTVAFTLKARSLTGQTELAAAVDFFIIPNELFTGLNYFRSVSVSIKGDPVATWNTEGINYNKHRISLAAVKNLDDEFNVYITPTGTEIGTIWLEYNAASTLDNFALDFVYEAVGYYNEDREIVAYPEDEILFTLVVGNPDAGPDASLKSLSINGETASYENSTSTVQEEGTLLISYQDSQKGLTITPTPTKTGVVVTTTLNDLPYTPSTKINDGDELTITVTDGSEVKVYTRTILVTAASNNTTATISPNKPQAQVSLTGNLFTVTVPYSITEIKLTPVLSDQNATTDVSELNFTNLIVGTSSEKTFKVTAEDGITNKTYSVKVVRLDGNSNTDINVTINGNTVTLTSDDVYNYTLNEGTKNYTLSATGLESTTKITYSTDGTTYSSQVLSGSLLKGSSDVLYVKATSENNTVKVYTINISRQQSTDVELGSVKLTEAPDYTQINLEYNIVNDRYEYTIKNNTSTNINLAIEGKVDEFQVVQFLNSARQPSTTILAMSTLQFGENVFYIQVTSQNGAQTREYELVIIKKSDERSITKIELQDIENGYTTIDPSLYTVNQSGNNFVFTFEYEIVNKVRIVVTSSPRSTITGTFNGQSQTNMVYYDKEFTTTNQQTLSTGTLKVTAENSMAEDYVIQVTRKAADTNRYLSDLRVNNVTLDGFAKTKFNGYATVIINRSSVSFNVEGFKESPKATIEYYLDGDLQANNQLSIQPGTKVLVEVKVIAQNGMSYTYSFYVAAQSIENDVLSASLLNVPLDQFTFNPGTYVYNITVPYTVTATKLTATASQYATLTGTGDYILSEGTTTIVLYATSESGQKSDKTYTFNITRQAARNYNLLESLQLIYDGKTVNLIPPTGQTVFTHRVDFDIDAVTIRATITGDQGERILNTVGTIFEQTYAISEGLAGETIIITVLAENGSTKEYKITIVRANTIATIDSVEIAGVIYDVDQFVENTLTLPSIPYSTSSLNVNVNPTDLHATFKTNPVLLNNTWTLTTHGKLSLSIEVTAQDGVTKLTYTINVNREAPSTNNELYDLEVLVTYPNGQIDLLENVTIGSTTDFKLRVDRMITSVTFKAYVKISDRSTLSGWGNPVVDGSYQVYTKTINLLSEGLTTTETISIFAENPSTPKRDYRVSITRKNADNDVEEITVKALDDIIFQGSLTELLDLDTLGSFAWSVKQFEVTVTKVDPFARLIYNNVEAGIGNQTATFNVTLQEGTNKTFSFKVETDVLSIESEDYKIQNITLTYSRNSVKTNNQLEGLEVVVDGINILTTQDPFQVTKAFYELRVDRGISSVDLFVYLKDENYSKIETSGFTFVERIDGVSKYYKEITFSAAQFGTVRNIEFVVKAESGTAKTYTLDIHNKNANATITEMLIDGDSFDYVPTTYNYNLKTYSYQTDKITLSLTKEDRYAKVTINGTVVANLLISDEIELPLVIGSNKQIKIEIETEIGNTDNKNLGYAKKTYILTYSRQEPNHNANLSELMVKALVNGSLVDLMEDKFNEEVYSYELIVERNLNSIEIIGTSMNQATVKNNGVKTLNNVSHTFEIIVTAEDGVTTKSYYVTILKKDSNHRITNITISGLDHNYLFDEGDTGIFDLGTVPFSTQSIIFDVTKESEYATLSINGEQTLKEGLNTFVIYATNERGEKGPQYTFTITRETAYTDVTLQNLEVLDTKTSENLITYVSGTFSYTIEITNQTKVNVIPTLKDATKQVLSGQTGEIIVNYNTNGTVNQEIKFTITVDGGSREYTILLVKGVDLSDNYNVDLRILDIYNNNYINFDMAITSYEITVPYAVDKLTFEFIKEHQATTPSWIKSVPALFQVGETTIQFVLRAENGSQSEVYTVKVNRMAPSTERLLQEILITSNGEKILGLEDSLYTFKEDQFIYNITLNETYESILIERTKKHQNQETSGKINQTNYLQHGLNTFEIVVTPEDKDALKATYTINITIKYSDIELLDLSVLGFDIDFDKDTFDYDLGVVDGRVSSITIEGTISNTYGSITGLGNKNLNLGLNTFTVVVKSEDLTKVLSYTITITKELSDDTKINELTLVDKSNHPLFTLDETTHEYTLEVDNQVDELKILYALAHPNAKLIGNTIYPLIEGVETTISFYVEAEDGTKGDVYTIKVIRRVQSADATIKSITIRDINGNVLLGLADINPSVLVFDPTKTSYTLNLDRSYEQVDIEVVLNDLKASLSGDVGLIDLLPGKNVNIFRYRVTSENGLVTKTYTININIANKTIDLTSLSVAGYTLTPNYDPEITSYSIGKIGADVAVLNVIGIISDPYGSLTGVGSVVTVAGNQVIVVKAISEDGLVTKTYTISYEKDASGGNTPKSSDANLYNLMISGLKNPIDFTFDPFTYEYDIELAYEDAQFFIDTETHARATVRGKGLKAIAPGETQSIIIQVTAEDGTLGEIYVLNVTRKAPSTDNQLLALWVVVDGETIELDITKKSFELVVSPLTTSIEIFGTKPQGATVHGLGEKALVDQTSIFTVTVVAENGSIETYNIQVKKVSNDATLKSLEVYDVKTGQLLPFTYNFDPNTYEYLITIGDMLVTDIEITGESTTTVNSILGLGIKNLKSGQGETTDRFNVIVTALDGETKITYTITIERNISKDHSIYIDNLFLSGNGVIYLGNDRHPNAITKFTASVMDYIIYVPYALNNVTLTIINPDGATIIGVGNYELQQKETIITFRIISKSGEVDSGLYTILVVKEDPSTNNLLTSILINGTAIEGFDSDILEYEITVDESKVKEINLSAVKDDSRSTISGNLGVLSVHPGTNTYQIVVKAEDGTERTYSVVVNALSFTNDILSLDVKDFGITPAFNQNQTTYAVNIPYDEQTIEIIATASPKATIIGTGLKTKLPVGQSVFEVYAVSEHGEAGTRYVIYVYRETPSDDTTLRTLEFYDRKNGTLYEFESTFDPLIREYIINLPEGVNIMSGYVVAEANDPKAIIFNDGNQLLGGFVDGAYHTILTILVQAESGLIESYKISIYRNVDLSNLTDIESIMLVADNGSTYFTKEDFDPNTLVYEVHVPYFVKSMNLSVTTVGTVYGTGLKSFNQNNTLTYEFRVVSQNTVNQTPLYTIIISRDEASNENKLNDLTINGVMVPNFNPDTNSYELTIPTHNPDKITLGASTPFDAVIQGLGEKTLVPGINTFNVAVIAQNGEVNTYTIIINYVDSNALLDTLIIKGSNTEVYDDNLSRTYDNFTFNPTEFEYTIVVDTDTTYIRITGAAQDINGARVTGFGTYKIGNAEEKIRIYVESASGLTVETYTLTITKYSIPSNNAKLKSLSVGGIDIGFTQNNYIYKVNLSNDVEDILLSAEAFNPNAKIIVEGYSSEPKNQVSLSIDDIESGKNVILIKVIAEDGETSEFYQLIVHRDYEPDLFMMMLLISSIILWTTTILVLLVRRHRKNEHRQDDVIF